LKLDINKKGANLTGSAPLIFYWSPRTDLNRQPAKYESIASVVITYLFLSFFPYSVPLSSTNSDSLKLPDQ